MDNRTILVIDDASDIRKLLRFHLENKKYNVLEATDGAEGLRLIHERRPDLIILDINMPKISGLEVYKQLIAGTGHSVFPVLVLTTRKELGPLFRDLDADGFITKPFDVEIALSEIDTIMTKRYRSKEFSAARPKVKKQPQKILIVEDNAEDFGRIVMTFINAGYNVSAAKGGLEAIDKIMSDLPEAILIKLGLPDLSGDLLASKLKRMPRTMDLPIVVYTPHKSTMDRAVAEKICENANIRLAGYEDPGELVKAMEAAITDLHQ